ncbi:MAG: GntR family transcriptional regulator [Sedimentitalea sp.]
MTSLDTVEMGTEGNLSAAIYSDLRMKLIVGDLKPVEALSIRTLADNYGVSAMPVREALRQLASEDALVGAAKKAYRVPDLGPQQAANLFFVRSVLEGAAAELAAQKMRKGDFKVLNNWAQKMEQAWAKRDASTLLRANFSFHNFIYMRADNAALQAIIDGLYARTGPWLAHGLINLVKPDHWLGEHADIIEALRSRDGPKARQLVEQDAKWGSDLYQQLE